MLFEYQETLLSVVWGAGVGLMDGPLLTLCSALLETVDEESEEEGYGKDRDKEVHNQPKICRDASSQALDPGEQALPKPWRGLADVQAVEILAGSRDIEESCAQFRLGLGRRISRAPQGPEPGTRAGTGRL
jgi:hypothetical protein